MIVMDGVTVDHTDEGTIDPQYMIDDGETNN